MCTRERERERWEGDSSLYTVALSASYVYQAVRRERDREGDSSLYTVALSASCVYQAVRRERDREGDSSHSGTVS